MSRSRRLFGEARRVIPSGVNSPVRHFGPYPFFVERSRGSRIWDADGRELVDMCCGYGALLLGHGRREVVSAVSRQLRRGTLYCAPTEGEVRLAELVTRCYGSVDRVRLVNTGAEAAMAAVRLARAHTGRERIIKFEGCYHGASDAMLVGAGSGAAHAGIPSSAGVPGAVAAQTLVARYNDADGVAEMLEQDGGVAAVIVEPVPANMGLVLPGPGFLRRLRSMTRRHGAVLIFDEVVTGFRAAPGGAQEALGVRPDLTTMAKALGGGLAIGALGGSRRIMDLLAPGGSTYQASTFAGNPVAVAAALASVGTLLRLRNRLYARLERRCAGLAAAVGDIASDLGIPHTVNSAYSMMQVFFTGGPVVDHRGAAASDAGAFGRMFRAMLRAGTFVAPSQHEVAFLSAAHTEEDVGRVLEAYRAGLGAAAR